MKLSEIPVCKVRLQHACCPLQDVAEKVREEFVHIRGSIKPGMTVAIAAGSRGVSNIAVVIKALVACLKEAGAEPFIVPAMGSHGGATAEGQRGVLAGYGITEELVGAPVRASMEVVTLGKITDPVELPVYMDKLAYEADGVIVVNRVKLHTDFHGPHESGIVKMLTIGLGKHAQALAVHHYGAAGLRDYIPLVSKKVLESGKILAGLALLEDGYENTADLKFAAADEIFDLDAAFLERSRQLVARLPFREIDTLIVDRMGKEISGTGMDTNVIGRIRIDGQEDGAPHCKRVAVLDLSEDSHGNALGVGLADVATAALRDKIDWKATNQNVITSGFLQRGFLPLIAETDQSAVALAVNSSGVPAAECFRLARIRDTLHLDEIYVSEALWTELEALGTAEKLTDFAPVAFDGAGHIAAF